MPILVSHVVGNRRPTDNATEPSGLVARLPNAALLESPDELWDCAPAMGAAAKGAATAMTKQNTFGFQRCIRLVPSIGEAFCLRRKR